MTTVVHNWMWDFEGYGYICGSNITRRNGANCFDCGWKVPYSALTAQSGYNGSFPGWDVLDKIGAEQGLGPFTDLVLESAREEA